MPHPGTHITIVQRLALSDPSLEAVLGSPNPVIPPNPTAEDIAAVRKMRFANLGAVGPDLLYFLLDYFKSIVDFQDTLVKLAGTLDAIAEVGKEVKKVQQELNNVEATLTCGVSTILGSLTGDDGVGGTVKLLSGCMTQFIEMFAVAAGFIPWSRFELRRQQNMPKTTWFWADFLHYAHTGDFVQALLENSRFNPKYKDHPNLFAYSLGYLTHYITDTVGHPYVNQVVQAPYRLYWQRHVLVENFIDAYVWNEWHSNPNAVDSHTGQDVVDPYTGEKPLDQVLANGQGTGSAPFQYARLNDLIDCGKQGIDPVDQFVSKIADLIKKGIDQIPGIKSIDPTDDAEFVLWTQFMADNIAQVYGNIPHPENIGLPSADDINGAYGVARFFLKLMTEEKIKEPEFPNIVGDISDDLKKMLNDLEKDIGAIPSPPGIDTGGSFSWSSFWHSLKSWAHWIVNTASAIIQAAIDLVKNLCDTVGQVGRDTVKMAFYLIHKALWSIYQAFREVLVLSAYAQPTLSEVKEFTSLWITPGNLPAGQYPVEEYFADGDIPEASLVSDYFPMVVPNTQPGALVEQVPVAWTAPYKTGFPPDVFIDGPLGMNDMFALPGKDGTGPTQDFVMPGGPVEFPRPSAFTDNPLDYGGAMANCSKAINAVLTAPPGAVLPTNMQFPNYNLDGDRGYGWPCWDSQNLRPTQAAPQVLVKPDQWKD